MMLTYEKFLAIIVYTRVYLKTADNSISTLKKNWIIILFIKGY